MTEAKRCQMIGWQFKTRIQMTDNDYMKIDALQL